MGLQETMKALANPVRRQILVLLKKSRLSAGDISRHFDLSQATISSHLKILKESDLVRETKYKNYIYYELNLSVFEETALWLTEFSGGKHDDE